MPDEIEEYEPSPYVPIADFGDDDGADDAYDAEDD